MPFQRGDDSGQKASGPAGRNPDELLRQGNGGAGPACGLPEFDEKTIAKNTDEYDVKMRAYAEKYEQELETLEKQIDKTAMAYLEFGQITKEEAVALEETYDISVKSSIYETGEPNYIQLWNRLAAKSPVVKHVWRFVTGMLESARHESKKSYKESKSFYRGTSMSELAKVVRDGGIAVRLPGEGAVGDSDPTSLTPVLEVAMQYASGRGEGGSDTRPDGVVLEYDAESIRRTGKARLMEYNVMGRWSRRKILPLRWSHQREITIPHGLKEPELVGVIMHESGARLNPDIVAALKDKGIKLTVIKEWSDASIYPRDG